MHTFRIRVKVNNERWGSSSDHVNKDGRREGGRKIMAMDLANLRRAQIPAANGTPVTLEQKVMGVITAEDLEAVRAGWKLTRGTAKGRAHRCRSRIETGYVTCSIGRSKKGTSCLRAKNALNLLN